MEERRYAMVMGGTAGLGRSLAEEALARGIMPIVLGRKTPDNPFDPDGMTSSRWDATDETTWRRAFDLAITARPAYLIWNAGIFKGRRPVSDPENYDDLLIDTHLRGPTRFLRRLHRTLLGLSGYSEPCPYHLVTIGSTSAFKMRDGEAMYCATKAAQVVWTRQFSRELTRELPGSKTTVINPGGMDSGLLLPYQDVSMMMKTPVVAGIIWDALLAQAEAFDEINIFRVDGQPNVVRGIQTPETP